MTVHIYISHSKKKKKKEEKQDKNNTELLNVISVTM